MYAMNLEESKKVFWKGFKEEMKGRKEVIYINLKNEKNKD